MALRRSIFGLAEVFHLGTCRAGFGPLFQVNMLAPPVDFRQETLGHWHTSIERWRDDMRAAIRYNGSIYDVPGLRWTRTSYIQPQVHVYDRYVYDHESGQYTVGRYLNDVHERYGGVDSVLLWPTYPSLGIDDRNQFDYMRAMPGGLEAVRKMTSEFHARGVHVLWPYNPFDEGTRSEGLQDWKAIAKHVIRANGDGVNGDTMEGIPEAFYQESVHQGKPLAFECEGFGTPGNDSYPDTKYSPQHWQDEPIYDANWLLLGWGYFGSEKPYPLVPGVDRAKWLDGRRLTHVNDRWLQNRTDTLQYAFFNGDGFSSWENVWGTWIGFTERDSEALRRVATILRFFGAREYIQGFSRWVPHPQDILQTARGIYGSRWEHHNGSILWTLVNRGGEDLDVAQLAVPSAAIGPGWHYYNTWSGTEIALNERGGLSFLMEAQGFGAVLATRTDDDAGLRSLLLAMAQRGVRPLSSYSSEWRRLPQQMRGEQSTSQDAAVRGGEMVPVPRGTFSFKSSSVQIEGGCDPTISGTEICCAYEGADLKDARCGYPLGVGEDKFGIDVMFPWEAYPQRTHQENLTLGPFWIDRFPVTCSQYAEYLNSTGYQPKDMHNWLTGWSSEPGSSPRPPVGHAKKPVTHVSLKEARAYCAWAGKRLPHAYEWQYAAQGRDGRRYPWGEGKEQTRFPEAVTDNRSVPVLADVDAHPGGKSPFGVEDLVGNVWQWTDEFADEHSRAAVLRGSSRYVPSMANSAYRHKAEQFPMRRQFIGPNRTTYRQYRNWYFPPALELDKHNKYMLMSDSFERAGTVGFRCLRDGKGATSMHLQY